MFPLNTAINYNQTKFFPIIMEELIGIKKKPSENTDVTKVEKSATEWKDAYKTLSYLTAFLGEIEQKKMFALMCLTPEKMNKLPAVALSNVLTQLDKISEKMKREIRHYERQPDSGGKINKSNLSEDEKRKIEKAIGKK